MLFPMLLLCAYRAGAGEDADFRRAQGYYTLQEYKLATESFAKYLTDFPKAERADQARLLLAESHYQLKQYPESAAAFDLFIAGYPQSTRRPDALLRDAKVHFLLKEPDKSLVAAECFLKENRGKLANADAPPALPAQVATALYYAGEDCYALKNAPQARTYWEELINTQPKSKLAAEASEGLGWIHFDAGEFEKALPRFEFTATIPDHPRAAWGKLMEGRALAALKRTDEALAAFKLSSSLPGSGKDVEAESALRTAEVLLSANKQAEAISAYRRLATEFPSETAGQALAVAALTSVDGKHYEDALILAELFLELQKTGPDRATVLRQKARALDALKKKADALAAAKQAVEESAGIADPSRKAEEHAASLLLLAELTPGANLETYNEIIRLYPENRYALWARYELVRLSGEADKIDEAYAKSLELLQLLARQPADRDQKSLTQLRRDALFAAAEFAFRKPDYKQAEAHLKAYSELAGAADPRADDVARKQAWCRHESADLPGTIQILDMALQAYPQSQYRDELLYLRAVSSAGSGQADAAQKYYDMLLKDFPASAFASQALYDSAAILFKAGKADEALARLNVLLDTKNDSNVELKADAFQLRAIILLQAGKHEQAALDAQSILKMQSRAKNGSVAQGFQARRRAAALIQAQALLAQGNKESEAETVLSGMIDEGPAIAPEVHKALFVRARLRFNAKKHAEAKEDLKTLVGSLEEPLAPDTVEAALYLALCHKELKETAEAKALLEKLLSHKLAGASSFQVPFQLGNLAFDAADYPAAAANYEKALAAAAAMDVKELAAADRAAAQLNLSWALRRGGKADEAEKSFAALIKLDPQGQYLAEALLERGNILNESGKLDEALQSWADLLARQPASAQAEKALFFQGQAHVKAAHWKDAAASFESYIQKFPQGASLREATCGLAECRLQDGNAAGAREAFLKVIGEKGPEEAELDEISERALLGLSELSLKQGDALAGKKLALRILTERPNSAWRDAAYLAAGQCSEGMKEPEKAIGYYRKLLSEYPKSTHTETASGRLKALGAPAKE